MFRFRNASNELVHVGRQHKYGDEPHANFPVGRGDLFEGSETVYTYSVPAGTKAVGDGKDLVMVYGEGEAAVKSDEELLAEKIAQQNAVLDAERDAALKAAETEGLKQTGDSTPA